MSLRVFYEVLNQRGTPALFTDTFANRPTFGFQGRLFISTDTAQIFEDTGTAWTLIADAGGGSFVPYTGATADVNLGSFDLTADIGIFNQVKAVGSGGLSINANSGTQIALLGAGGGANITFYGGLSGTTASLLNSSASTGLDVASDKVIFRANTGVSTPRQVEISMGGATSTFLDAKGFGANYITDFGIRTYNSIGTAFNVFYGTSAGNVIVGGTTDAGFRLDCIGSARVQGTFTQTGSSNSATFGNGFVIDNGNGNRLFSPTSLNLQSNAGSGNFVAVINNQGSVSISSGSLFSVGFSNPLSTQTSGTINNIYTHSALGSSTGSLNFNSILINPTINTTGTYSGIIRGLHYNPILTSIVGTHRAIETTTGDVLLGTTSGNVSIGTTTQAYKTAINGVLRVSAFNFWTNSGASALQVDGTSSFSDITTFTSGKGMYFGNSSTAIIGTQNSLLGFRANSGNDQMKLFGTGNLVINNATDNGQGVLQVSGNIYVSGIGAAGSTYSVSSTLSTAYYHVFTGAAGQTLTLPSPASNNVQYLIINNTANTVDVAAATSTNIVTTLGTSVASITLIANQRVFIIANGGTNYFQIF
jgi:hypothetical protein